MYYIIHAGEDRNIAIEISNELIKNGYDVWLDLSNLNSGELVTTGINRGIKDSDYAIVIVSPSYLKKGFPNIEFASFLLKKKLYNNTIIPIWHDIDLEQVRIEEPLLSCFVGIESKIGISNIIKNILHKETISINDDDCFNEVYFINDFFKKRRISENIPLRFRSTILNVKYGKNKLCRFEGERVEKNNYNADLSLYGLKKKDIYEEFPIYLFSDIKDGNLESVIIEAIIDITDVTYELEYCNWHMKIEITPNSVIPILAYSSNWLAVRNQSTHSLIRTDINKKTSPKIELAFFQNYKKHIERPLNICHFLLVHPKLDGSKNTNHEYININAVIETEDIESTSYNWKIKKPWK